MRRLFLERKLFLAIRDVVYLSLFNEPLGQMLLEDEDIALLVFDSETEVIVQWTS